jgi:hypothetical protein
VAGADRTRLAKSISSVRRTLASSVLLPAVIDLETINPSSTCPTKMMTMKTVSAREANHEFSDLLSRCGDAVRKS